MSFDLAAARNHMVDSQVRVADVTDLAIQDAMASVPREALAPADQRHRAYADAEIPYAPGRWMLRPRDVGKLLQALAPQPGERALAIAAPYAAAVLEAIGLKLARLDGDDLSAPTGEYDLVVSEGAVAKAPAAWLAALAPGGRLGVIERDGLVGRARLYLRSTDGIGARTLFDATPPMMAGFEAPRVFSL